MGWLKSAFNKTSLLGNDFLGTGVGFGILGAKQKPGFQENPYSVGVNNNPADFQTGFGEYARGLSQTSLSNGMPAVPNFNSIRGKDGNLMDQYKINAGKMGDATSWMNAMKAQNGANMNNSFDSAVVQSQSSKDTAMADLGMSGGLSSGARERIAKMGGRDLLNTRQDIGNQSNLNELNINLEGENMNRDAERFNISNDLAGQQFNAGNAIADVGGLNTANMTGYSERMKDFIGTKLANAQAKAAHEAGNKGPLSFLGL